MKDLEDLKKNAARQEQANKKLFRKLGKEKPRHLDETMRELHQQEFEHRDCLQCANCCKTTSPVFYRADIERVSRSLKMRPAEFTDRYLHVDEDGDYVLNTAPCPFLAGDNTCIVYDNRPTACREYPHTDRKRFHQVLNITLKNTFVCPAVFNIVENLKKRLGDS